MLVTQEKIAEAFASVAKITPPSPLVRSPNLEGFFGGPVYLKLENLNTTGSFKIRGASNLMLNAEIPKSGVVAMSAGNHAQGVAYVAKHLGVKATIFMPEFTPLIKADLTRSHGAEVILSGAIVDDSYIAAMEHVKEHGSLFVHPYADPRIVAGQGSIGIELLDQLDNIGVVIVPVGGGGLISGVSCYVKEKNPNIKIIGVQTELYPSLKESFNYSDLSDETPKSSIADGIAVKSVSGDNLEVIRKYVDEMISVSEDDIAGAMMELIERDHILAEGAGAVPVAALKSHSKQISRLANGKNVVCLISGGNVDMSLISTISVRGLIKTGRLMRLRINIADRPGELAKLLDHICKTGANITEVLHERAFSSVHYKEAEVEVICETINLEHQLSIKNMLINESVQFTVH